MTGKTYPSIHGLLHDFYITSGRTFSPYARAINWSARNLLKRTRILDNLSRARTLRKLLDRAFASGQNDDEAVMDRFELHDMLIDCYDVMVDDLLLLSAFENHAKAALLGSGYVVHEIAKPSVLRKRQREHPVHVRAVRAALTKGTDVTFSEKTIGLQDLLKPAYLKRFPMPKQVATGIDEIRGRRNQIHFNTGYAWTVTTEVLATVAHLDSTIPKRKTPWSRIRKRTLAGGARRAPARHSARTLGL